MNQLTYCKRLASIYFSYITKKVRIGYPPFRLWIELTNLCNLRCKFCPNKDLNSVEKGGFMDFGLFKKIINEACKFTHDINLFHRGESLLHPQFIDMIRYADSKKLYTKIHTNGTKLSEEMSCQIFESGLDFISFSFDGFDKTTYEYYRQGSNFENTLKNILFFLTLKKKLKKKKPYAVFEVINYPDSNGAFNRLKENEFRNIFVPLPLNKFIVKSPHNWAGHVNLTGQNCNSNVHSLCTFLWHSLVVLWDGRVSVCPQDCFGEIIVGNAYDATLKEIFYGQPISTLRQRMKTRQVEGLVPCCTCDMIKRRKVFGVPIASLKFLRR